MTSRLFLLLSLLLAGGCSGGSGAPSEVFEVAVQGTYAGALNTEGQHALVGSIQHGGSLWNTRTQERLYNWNHREGDFNALAACGFSPEGDYALTATEQDLVLWQVFDGQPVWFWDAPAEVRALALAADGARALLGLADHRAVLFDSKRGGIVRQFAHEAPVTAVALNAEGTRVLTGGADDRARLWNAETGELLHEHLQGNDINTLAISPDGSWVFSAAQLDSALIWRTSDGAIHQQLSGDEALLKKRLSYTAARFSADGSQLLTGTTSGQVQLWNVSTGEELKRWSLDRRNPFRPTSARVQALAFAGEDYLALASNGFINRLR